MSAYTQPIPKENAMNDINALIEAARAKGATVLVSYDDEALRQEGRNIIETVTVIGLRGVGPLPMPEIAARERLMEVLA
jgi:ribosomal protein S10